MNDDINSTVENTDAQAKDVTLTCNQLGGPAVCNHEMSASSFEEMGGKSQAHVKEMLEAGDEGHKEAVGRMMAMTPEDQQKEMMGYKQAFDSASPSA